MDKLQNEVLQPDLKTTKKLEEEEKAWDWRVHGKPEQGVTYLASRNYRNLENRILPRGIFEACFLVYLSKTRSAELEILLAECFARCEKD